MAVPEMELETSLWPYGSSLVTATKPARHGKWSRKNSQLS